MLRQIRLLACLPPAMGGPRMGEQNPDLTAGCPTIVGVIVHRRAQLETSPQPTEHHNILRCTLQRLPDLLLAKRLPGERPRPKTRR